MTTRLNVQILSWIWIARATASAATHPGPHPEACLTSWSRYSSISASLGSQSYTTTLTTTEIWSLFPEVPTSTFCDNIPRLLGRQYSDYVTEWYPTTTFTTWSSMTSPAPTCTVNESDCASLKSRWNATHPTATDTVDFPLPCTTYRPCSADPIGPCSIAADNVKIYYWPTPATAPLCAPNTTLFSTARPTPPPAPPAKPVTKVIDGLTATSPTLYISLPTLWGRFRGQPTYLFTGCGSRLASLTLAMAPTSLSTLTRQTRARRPTYESPRPFALSTMNWPVTTTSRCTTLTGCDWDEVASTCADFLTTTCTTPTVDPWNYGPALLVPTSLVDVAVNRDAGYQGCVVHPAAAAGATWIPITTLPGDPRFTEGWSKTSTVPPRTVSATKTPEVTASN